MNARAAAAVSRGAPEVARQDLTERPAGAAAGDEVALVGPRGRRVGRALWEPEGPVAAWVVRGTLEEAVARRRFDPAVTDAYRLVHGAGDGLPGLFVDRFGDARVVATRAAAWRARLPALGLEAPPPAEVEVRENGLRFLVRPASPKPGLFLDMRENRARTAARARGRDVLNLFAYTGSFGVACAAAGARRVLNVDVSARALAWARRNFELNGVTGEFEEAEASTWLARTRERFDLVILDPPTFSRAPERTESVERDYPELVALARRVLRPGGLLAAALNTHRVPRERFAAWLGGRATVYGEGPDFPESPRRPGGRTLKFAIVR